MPKVYLTIAVPTFNRSRFLEKSLESLTSQEVFFKSHSVEIIVSDNCSTDDTENVCIKYLQKYPGKFFYYKNLLNIGDKNFHKSLSHGSGEFLKLSNDTLCYEKNSLEHMVELVKDTLEKKPVLFFLNKSAPTPANLYMPINPDDFINKATYFVTWIACFGIWKSDFDKLSNFNRASESKLTQVDVIFRMLSEPNKNSLIDNTHIFDVQHVANKGGYGLFTVFVENYFNLLDQFKFDGNVIKSEKKNILLKHVSLFDAESVFKHSFCKEKRFKILLKNTKNIRSVVSLYYVFYLLNFLKFFIKYKVKKQ